MKHIGAIGLAGLLFLYAVTAHAGAIQIGLLDDEQFAAWKCSSPVAAVAAQPKPDCGVTKYGETSSCPNLIVTNDSDRRINVVVQLTGLGFEEPPNHWGGMFDFGGPSCSERTIEPCDKGLAPGQSCYQNVDFSPERAGLRHGDLEVLVTGAGEPISRTYDLTAVGEYPPELKGMDAAIQNHEAELLRIPHVVRLSISDFSENTIQVEVAHEADIQKVERSIPSKLDGYPVEVIEAIERGWAL